MNRELVFYLDPRGNERHAIMTALAARGVRRIGVDGFPWRPGRDAEEIERFRADLRSTGLTVHSMHAVPPLAADADGMPDDLFQVVAADLHRLAAAGGATAVYHACWMRDVPPETIDAEIGRVGWRTFASTYAATVDRIAEIAAKHGIAVVLENVWHSTYSRSVVPILDILDRVDAPNVGICLDSGHAHLAGCNVAEEIRTAGTRLKDMHFHDNAGTLHHTHPDQHLPPGLGTIDWQAVCRALNRIDYRGPVVFEGVLGPGDSIEKGRFGGRLSHEDLIDITVANWRAFEALAVTQ
ncbi:MAG: sugar phosphate isomerase/epimerase [Kiritimatiellaeota bacterium]|nr:sugar phosphate isomerase/epimerase [Kiritimatiellota bacterium]